MRARIGDLRSSVSTRSGDLRRTVEPRFFSDNKKGEECGTEGNKQI